MTSEEPSNHSSTSGPTGNQPLGPWAPGPAHLQLVCYALRKEVLPCKVVNEGHRRYRLPHSRIFLRYFHLGFGGLGATPELVPSQARCLLGLTCVARHFSMDDLASGTGHGCRGLSSCARGGLWFPASTYARFSAYINARSVGSRGYFLICSALFHLAPYVSRR